MYGLNTKWIKTILIFVLFREGESESEEEGEEASQESR